MSERTIATVCAEQGYDGLHQAFRARFEELGIKRDAIDELAGLTRGHASKILSPYPMKAIGRTTLGPMLYAAKLKLIIVADDTIVWADDPGVRAENHVRNAKPLSILDGNSPEIRTLRRKVMRETLQKRGRKGGRKSMRARTKQQRSRFAKKGWRRRRKLERERRLRTRCAPGGDR